MSDREAAPVSSPCIDVCTLDASGRVCLGCYRTIDEIVAWSTLDDDQRRAVKAALPARREQMTQRKGSHGQR